MQLIETLVRHFSKEQKLDGPLFFRVSNSTYHVTGVSTEGVRFNYSDGSRGGVLKPVEYTDLYILDVEIVKGKRLIDRPAVCINGEWRRR